MAEIKLNDAFYAEVEAFRAASDAFDGSGANSVSSDGLSLPTVDAYLERIQNVVKVLEKFKTLAGKDASDVKAIADKLKAADSAG